MFRNDPVSLVFDLLVFIAYFLPTIVAYLRDRKDWPLIAIANTFLGWTVLVWIASLTWALSSHKGQDALATETGSL